MATSLPDNFTNYWRVLGLSVAVGYAGLGSWALLRPTTAADTLGLRARNNPDAQRIARDSMYLLGARDFSIATALFAFYYQNKPHAMGTLITSSMILCAVDTIWVWRLRGDLLGPLLGVGASFWAYVGYGLLKL